MDIDISEKRCTRFPTSADIEGGTVKSAEIATHLTEIHKVSHGRLQKPPKLPVSAKRPPSYISGEPKRLEQEFCQSGTPWGKYERFSKEGKSENTYLAFEPKSRVASMVAIKVYQKLEENPVERLAKTSHLNLANLKDVFVDKTTVFLIYERMDLSLACLHSCVSLKESHIATICKEVTQGLSYIHRELHISHGEIKTSNIFLTLSGNVKIGNIGKSMLNQRSDIQQDICAIGWMMMEIMEPGNSYLQPKSLTLKEPNKWSAEIREFLKKTSTGLMPELQAHTFLLFSVTATCLAPLVLMGGRISGNDWSVFAPER